MGAALDCVIREPGTKYAIGRSIDGFCNPVRRYSALSYVSPMGPVHVLQDADRVVRRRQPEIVAHLFGPDGRQVRHGEIARHQRRLDPGAHHDVQVVGQFVRLDPDQAGANRVDRAPERRRVHIGELIGEGVAKRAEVQLPEPARTADAIFHEP